MKTSSKIVPMLLLGSLLMGVSAYADESSNIMQKLGEIQQNQQSILAKLEELKSEIQIVKVRSTING